ncbi:condensation domain-containing protein [Pseudacidobacterium ailaaui]|uniref:condensation domain-containing protein n=1 Tax=Pseudacidobacterium ailaaui TaxID=1382359 RepID=UPI00138E2F35|nr:condensation domain-containing protein [Pseudacidobacterium ailaaui]MBX6359021.1 hypothetical protein [Pseudacidobacterium ailaaui]MDI3254137.1 condensation domain-containing protein [Bacillota bacterium]
MKRPLTMFERALYFGAGFHVNVMITARISGLLTETQIRHALRRVQEKHAILRCLVVEEDKRPWFVMQENPVPIPIRMIERRHEDDWLDVAMQESLQPFEGSKGPLARLVWVQGKEQSELLLVCSHALCDGRSLVTLLCEILLLCDQPHADIGVRTSMNALEEVFPADVWADRRLQRRIRVKVAAAKFMLRLTRTKPAWTYGRIYRCLWTMDEDVSQKLIANCKKEGTSVFAALSIACMKAFAKVCGPERIRKYEAPVDFRRYLPGLRSDSLFAIAPTIELSLRKLHRIALTKENFWGLARSLKADMAARMEKLNSSVFPLFLGMEQFHDVYDRMAAYAQSKRAGSKVSLSYVGKIDLPQQYAKFRLLDICDISAMMLPTPAHLIAMYSFAGRFHFSLASDESSLPHAEAMEIRNEIMTELHRCVEERPATGALAAGATLAAPAEAS